MLSGLKLINFSPCEASAARLESMNRGHVFILKTCQRTLLLGFNKTPDKMISKVIGESQSTSNKPEVLAGTDAYEFLLETICGLKSRVLGENEIVHQFKEAYTTFMAKENPNRLIQNLLEKLFKDAKDIRSQHLKNIGLQTYAGITRKLLSQKVKAGERIVILGSGELAEDLIKIIHRRYEVFICARNENRVSKLTETYGVESIPWGHLNEALKEKVIVNTIGTTDTIIDAKLEQEFLSSTDLKTLVCLAEPSPYPWQDHPSAKSVFLLNDIFKYAEHFNLEKKQKVSSASLAIKAKSQHRQNHFTLHLPFGWDELQFA